MQRLSGIPNCANECCAAVAVGVHWALPTGTNAIFLLDAARVPHRLGALGRREVEITSSLLKESRGLWIRHLKEKLRGAADGGK